MILSNSRKKVLIELSEEKIIYLDKLAKERNMKLDHLIDEIFSDYLKSKD